MRKKFAGIVAVALLSSIVSATNILIKIPTRQRPDRFFNCLNLYYAKLSGKHPVQFLISCDSNDPSMNNASVINRMKSYKNLKAIYGHSNSKIDAYNRDMELTNPFDIIIVTSDDTIPVTNNYDDIIACEMTKNFPDFDGVLRFNDGVTPMTSPLNTLPIIGRKFYERFNYIYHPDYKAFFCDLELSLMSRFIGKEAAIDKILFKHDHPLGTGAAPDQLYKQNAVHWEYDKAKFKERAVRRFDIKGFSEEQFSSLDELVKFCLTFV